MPAILAKLLTALGVDHKTGAELSEDAADQSSQRKPAVSGAAIIAFITRACRHTFLLMVY